MYFLYTHPYLIFADFSLIITLVFKTFFRQKYNTTVNEITVQPQNDILL